MAERPSRVRLLKALAHPVRLRIVDILVEKPQCVCHLTTLVGKPQPYVSQQLAVLHEAGLVEAMRDGVYVHYRVKAPRLSELCALTRAMSGELPQPDLSPDLEGPFPGCNCPECRSA